MNDQISPIEYERIVNIAHLNDLLRVSIKKNIGFWQPSEYIKTFDEFLKDLVIDHIKHYHDFTPMGQDPYKMRDYGFCEVFDGNAIFPISWQIFYYSRNGNKNYQIDNVDQTIRVLSVRGAFENPHYADILCEAEVSRRREQPSL